MSDQRERYQTALDLFFDSVLEPDHSLRVDAAKKGCYEELMEIRHHVLTYLTSLKEVNSIEMADESDDIESLKVIVAKQSSRPVKFFTGESM